MTWLRGCKKNHAASTLKLGEKLRGGFCDIMSQNVERLSLGLLAAKDATEKKDLAQKRAAMLDELPYSN